MDVKGLIACAGLSLAGCSGLYHYEPPGYVVRTGDTVYTIAWRYGIDHRDLAAWNRLSDPDRIYAGQRLVLSGPRGAGRGGAVEQRAAAPAGLPAGASAGASTSTTPSAAGSPSPSASSPPQRRASSGSAPASAPPAPSPRRSDPVPAWQWPVAGPVVQRFGSAETLSSGIAIGGQEGRDIAAAAAGRVVYAGSGLIGYGQLVIIKHSETYLSAYGYNSRLHVVQGQDVARGEVIAEMGLGPERQPRLHFEIRRNGDPVDPLGFLGG